MRHRKHAVHFGRQRDHYRATLHHLVAALVINKSIRTTKVKAKEASRLAEKLVTIAKNKTVANQRRVYAILRSRELVAILFNEVAPLFENRNGGYTRVMLTGRRHGDNAQMAILEFVEKPKKEPVVKKGKKEPKKPEVKTKPKVETEKKEETIKVKAPGEEVLEKKEEHKKPTRPPKGPDKPRREVKPRPGFFKKLFGRKKGQ